MTLQQRFEDEMWRIHREARLATARYDGRWFEGQLRQTGSVATAKRVLSSKEIQSGFTDMVLVGRTDLTVEALACDPQWRELFTPEEIREAQRRLGRENDAPG